MSPRTRAGANNIPSQAPTDQTASDQYDGSDKHIGSTRDMLDQEQGHHKGSTLYDSKHRPDWVDIDDDTESQQDSSMPDALSTSYSYIKPIIKMHKLGTHSSIEPLGFTRRQLRASRKRNRDESFSVSPPSDNDEKYLRAIHRDLRPPSPKRRALEPPPKERKAVKASTRAKPGHAAKDGSCCTRTRITYACGCSCWSIKSCRKGMGQRVLAPQKSEEHCKKCQDIIREMIEESIAEEEATVQAAPPSVPAAAHSLVSRPKGDKAVAEPAPNPEDALPEDNSFQAEFDDILAAGNTTNQSGDSGYYSKSSSDLKSFKNTRNDPPVQPGTTIETRGPNVPKWANPANLRTRKPTNSLARFDANGKGELTSSKRESEQLLQGLLNKQRQSSIAHSDGRTGAVSHNTRPMVDTFGGQNSRGQHGEPILSSDQTTDESVHGNKGETKTIENEERLKENGLWPF